MTTDLSRQEPSPSSSSAPKENSSQKTPVFSSPTNLISAAQMIPSGGSNPLFPEMVQQLFLAAANNQAQMLQNAGLLQHQNSISATTNGSGVPPYSPPSLLPPPPTSSMDGSSLPPPPTVDVLHSALIAAASNGTLPHPLNLGLMPPPHQATFPPGLGVPPPHNPLMFHPMNAGFYGPSMGAAGFPYGLPEPGRRKNATRETTMPLKHWLTDHKKNPYPTKQEKMLLAILTKMSMTQVSTWFANARRRLKKENKMTWSPRHRPNGDDDFDDFDDDNDNGDGNAGNGSIERASSSASVSSGNNDHTTSRTNFGNDNESKRNEKPLQGVKSTKIWSIENSLLCKSEADKKQEMLQNSSCSSADELKLKTNGNDAANSSSSSSLSPARPIANGTSTAALPQLQQQNAVLPPLPPHLLNPMQLNPGEFSAALTNNLAMAGQTHPSLLGSFPFPVAVGKFPSPLLGGSPFLCPPPQQMLLAAIASQQNSLQQQQQRPETIDRQKAGGVTERTPPTSTSSSGTESIATAAQNLQVPVTAANNFLALIQQQMMNQTFAAAQMQQQFQQQRGLLLPGVQMPLISPQLLQQAYQHQSAAAATPNGGAETTSTNNNTGNPENKEPCRKSGIDSRLMNSKSVSGGNKGSTSSIAGIKRQSTTKFEQPEMKVSKGSVNA